MTTRSDVVAAARGWIGTPWVHQHRAKGVGVDCVGLVIGVGRELGLCAPDFDVQGYPRLPDGTLLLQCAQLMRQIPRDTLQPGDVLVISSDVDPAHMGIVGDYRHGGLSLIHAALGGSGRVVEHRLMFARNMKFKAAYALPGMA